MEEYEEYYDESRGVTILVDSNGDELEDFEYDEDSGSWSRFDDD